MRFIKNQEASRFVLTIILIKLNINKIVHKFSLAGDKFMPELHLRQPGFTYNAYGLSILKGFKTSEKQTI